MQIIFIIQYIFETIKCLTRHVFKKCFANCPNAKIYLIYYHIKPRKQQIIIENLEPKNLWQVCVNNHIIN